MGLPINFDPSQPIENTPFFSPRTNSISSPQGAGLVIGSGLEVSQDGYLNALGTVDVTLVNTGVGLTGGPITSTGTISLADTAVTAGSYTYGSFTVDAQGRITAAASGTAAVTAVTGTTPISVTSGSTPVVSVANSSTSGKGVVQLNDSTNNSSTDLALTAAQGKNLQDQIDALAITSNLTFAGTFDTSVGPNGEMVAVSAAGAALTAPFVVGDALPTPAAENAEFFVIIVTGGDYGPTTTPASTPPFHVGDWFLSDGTAWEFLNLGFQAPAATTTVEGVVYLATDLEVQTGTDTSNKAVNPASLQAKVSDSTSTTDSFAIASSTAVKSAYDLANAAIPNSTFNSKGDIIVGTGNDTYGNFPTGTNGQILVVDSAETFGVKWADSTPDGVQGVTGTAPITVDNTDAANPIIGIDAASTTAAGAVQLNDTTNSTSTTEAATANAVKSAYDLANSALPLAGGTMTGSIVFNDSEVYTNLGVCFQDFSKIQAISDSTSTTSSTTAASSTAVKTAWDLANAALPLAGGSMAGDIVLFSQVPVNSANPASKYYADQIAAGFKPQTAVAAATTAALAGVVTYNNGTAGVGATLTLNTPITAIDGVTITTVGTRVLIKNQVATLQNGVYTYTSGGATTVLTRATDADEASELLAGNAYFVNAGTVNANNTLVQIPTVATVGTSSITYTLSSVKPFHKYSLEWNVDPVGGDDTNGTGGDQQPYKTIAKALISAGNTGSRIILHQGTYTENLTIPNLNLEIVGATRSGATINGTIAFTNASSSTRVYGIQFLGNITHTGAGGVYIQSGTFAPGISLTKSGSGYLELDDMSGDSSTVSVTGTGYVNYFNSRIGGITVNNAAAFVTLQDMSLVGPTTVTAGIFQVNHANYFAATESGNAITAASGTTVTLRNTNFYTPSGVVARVSLAGNYSFNDVVVDRANSTLGTNLGSIARFDAIDTFGPVYANGSAGTAGQVLTSCGAGVAPAWAATAIPTAATPTVAGTVLGCTNASNAALGCNALRSLTSGTGNAALGSNALCSTTTGAGNVAIGVNAGCSISTQVNNVFVGNSAGLANITSGSVGIGTSALICTTTGGRNTAVGEQTSQSNVTGEYNAAFGWSALQNSTGGCNTALGGAAGQSITTGGYNVAIGSNVQVTSGTASCQLAIGWEGCRWITGDAGKNLCVYNSFVVKAGGGAGPTGIASNDTYFYADSAFGATLSLGNTFGDGKQYVQFRNPSNAVIGWIAQATNTSISYVTSSDYRLKENVKDIEGATEVLRALPVHEFNFISEPEVVHQGFLAHELQEFVPLAVTGTKDEVDEEGNAKYQGVDASKVVPLLVAALKESIARIDALEAEVKELKSNT